MGKSRTPTQQMKSSLVYNLVKQGYSADVKTDQSKFVEVYRSKYHKVRVYKIIGVDLKSKEWGANPKNRVCDVEGGWYCRGTYPPALYPYLMQGKDFVQLEDFNKKDSDSEYQKEYFEKLNAKKKEEGSKKKSSSRSDL